MTLVTSSASLAAPHMKALVSGSSMDLLHSRVSAMVSDAQALWMSTQGLIQSLAWLQAWFNMNTTELDVLLQEHETVDTDTGSWLLVTSLLNHSCHRWSILPNWTCSALSPNMFGVLILIMLLSDTESRLSLSISWHLWLTATMNLFYCALHPQKKLKFIVI